MERRGEHSGGGIIKNSTQIFLKINTFPRIRPEVAAKLKYYVYAYIDPLNYGEIFYVGKGRGKRALAHLNHEGENAKVKRIQAIKATGKEPRIDIIAHGLANEETAFRIEAALIDVLTLTNQIRGVHSLELGRIPLAELEFQYAAKPIKITEPAMLIRINRTYRPGMSAAKLYQMTRSNWRCSKQREQVRYAFAIYQGVVREVYAINQWRPCPPKANPKAKGRWIFDGSVALKLSKKYKGGCVEKYFPKSAQTPFTYINCGINKL